MARLSVIKQEKRSTRSSSYFGEMVPESDIAATMLRGILDDK
jgi:hypothetical protein